MIPHRQIADLRDDDTPQRHAQAALVATMDDWRGQTTPAAVFADLARFGATSAGDLSLTDFPALAALFAAGGEAAPRLIADLVAANLARLAAAPLGQVAMRHFTNGTLSTLLLGRAGRAMLVLVATDGPALARQAAPASITFNPTDSWEYVLAGRAEATLVTRGRGGSDPLAHRPLPLAPGAVLVRDGRHQALLPGVVQGALVMLRLERRRPSAEPACEFALPAGPLLQRSAGSPWHSRHELMMALLGRMERADAAPILARIAAAAGPDTVRWQALREALGLDTALGFAALCTIAGDAADPLAAAAGALRGQLLETYPQLATIEAMPCPA